MECTGAQPLKVESINKASFVWYGSETTGTSVKRNFACRDYDIIPVVIATVWLASLVVYLCYTSVIVYII